MYQSVAFICLNLWVNSDEIWYREWRVSILARAKDRVVFKYMVDAYKAAEKIVLMLFLQACKVFLLFCLTQI